MMMSSNILWLISIALLWKVDISTMLEEAVQYVKFLQLQIKVRTASHTRFCTDITIASHLRWDICFCSF